ncbi:hypothetical protein XaFJ1_GM002318 [Xanthomonas albilineans]|nr:hypothetical protein XaFJ1_GM002318 [Xanthomonas albilineans]
MRLPLLYVSHQSEDVARIANAVYRLD